VRKFVVKGTIGAAGTAHLEPQQQLHRMFVLITNLEDREAFSVKKLLDE
jgi:hypothetical protein